MNEDLVSIIIPVFNGNNYIKNSIDSALNQSYKNIELIVINDGSTDNTEDIIKSYGNKVKYFYKENGGVSSALNLGITKANGKYISWLSHDDLYLPKKIETQMEELKNIKDKSTIIYSGYELIDCKDNLISAIEISSKNEYRHLNNGLYASLMYYLYGCTLLIPREVFYKVSFFNEKLKYCQDYELWLKIFKNGYNIRYIPRVLVQYRIHGKQDSNTKKEYMISEAENIFINTLSNLSDKQYEEIFYNKYNVLRIIEDIHKDFPRVKEFIYNEKNNILIKNKDYIENNNKISVVVYINDDDKYINQTINSILNQKYKNIELLFIIKDNTIVNGLPKNIEYKIITEREDLLDYINGDFIQFLRSGDILLDDKFSLQIEEFKNNPYINVSYSKYYKIHNNKKRYPKDNSFKISNLKQFEDLINLWEEKIYIPLYTLLIKKTALKDMKINYNNDYLFNIHLSFNSYFKLIDKYLVYSYNSKIYKKDLNVEYLDFKNRIVKLKYVLDNKRIKNNFYFLKVKNNFSYLIIHFIGIKITIKRNKSFIYKLLLLFSEKD